jgi:hypothetical protein
MPTCALELQNYYAYGKNNRRLVVESPEIYDSKSMRSYIEQEIARPCKQWIHDVISSKREAERVRLRTDDFVLLPDVDCMNRRFQSVIKDSVWPNPNAQQFECHPNATRRSTDLVVSRSKHSKFSPGSFHWLAVVTDPGLKTLRDLRGKHVPLLKTIYNSPSLPLQQDLVLRLLGFFYKCRKIQE